MATKTAEEIIDLMFLPLTDNKVVETLDSLGIEQPSLDEKYEMEGRIAIIDTDNSGLQFEFEELDDYDAEGEPILTTIAFDDEKSVSFPYSLHKNDSYETVVQKMGRGPDFCLKSPMEWSKQWVFPFKNSELTMAVHFKPNMESINTIVVGEFEREGIEEDPFIFPCNELEK